MALLVADIGGTRARFAIARTHDDGIVLERTQVFAVADYRNLASALRAYAARLEGPLPGDAAFALAADISADTVEMVNSDWIVDRQKLVEEFGFESCLLLNDFEAIAHSVAIFGPEGFANLFGPRGSFARAGGLSIIGPGTGLGVAQLIRAADGHCHVVRTEGGHIGFAPQTAFERRLYEILSDRHGRVSVERVASGPALSHIYGLLAGRRSDPTFLSDSELWSQAINGDGAASKALHIFLEILGSIVGDLALAHGSDSVVFVGSLAGRLQDRFPSVRFRERFLAKGRFAARMSNIGVAYLLCDQPGLLGAAWASRARTGKACL